MKKLYNVLFLIVLSIGLLSCVPKSDNASNDPFIATLQLIQAPPMSVSIVDANEKEQLHWFAEIYRFELATLQSKTSALTLADLKSVQTHLSQVYGDALIELLLAGFYAYDAVTESYYVPDGSWFTYNERWSDSHLSVSDRTEGTVTFILTGTDDYGDNEREINHTFRIVGNRLVLEQRTYIK